MFDLGNKCIAGFTLYLYVLVVWVVYFCLDLVLQSYQSCFELLWMLHQKAIWICVQEREQKKVTHYFPLYILKPQALIFWLHHRFANIATTVVLYHWSRGQTCWHQEQRKNSTWSLSYIPSHHSSILVNKWTLTPAEECVWGTGLYHVESLTKLRDTIGDFTDGNNGVRGLVQKESLFRNN